MEWQTGVRLLSTLSFGGKVYNLIVLKQDVGIKNYYIRLIEGEYNIPWDQMIPVFMVIFPDQLDAVDFPTFIKNRKDAMNQGLKEYFLNLGIPTVPSTFLEQLEAAIASWKLVLINGIPQIE